MQLIEIKRDKIDQFLADLSLSIQTVTGNGWRWVPLPAPLPRWEPCEAPPYITPDLTLLQARALRRAINEALRLTAPKVVDIAVQLNDSTWRVDVSDGGKFEFSYFENV